MVIWNRLERGRGTGSMALGLAVRELSQRGVCTKFFAEVKEANERGFRFWKKNGFMETGRRNGTLIMCLSLPGECKK
jgi:ribosomal protein S18 acetylase RimI-like enzyme